jgi:type IV pilus assembly protein PilB
MTPKDRSADTALLKFLARADVVPSEMAQDAERALLDQRNNGMSAIDWLTRKGRMDEEQLARRIAELLHLPYVNLPAVVLNASVTALVKEELASRCGVVPLRAPEGGLVVATANPLDREALRAVEFATGRRVHAEVAMQAAVRDALEHAYHLDDTLNAYLKGIPEAADVPVAELPEEHGDLKSLMRETGLPPVVKLFNLILLEGIRSGASDVHIEPSQTELRVRYRIDGILEESFHLPKWIQDPLTARCKVLARLDITERRVPQDGRIRVNYREHMIDLRVSSLPTQFGEKVTMRILDPSGAPSGLDRFGFSVRDLECIRQAIARPEGMILVTGPTGSGKSTTLYGMLAEMISPTTNIVTIENPIEYQLRGVNQVEINEKQGLTFAGTLRSILRQDPDVILVGEVRDAETAEIALRAAQTGHLVLSTLHTNDAVSTVTRLIDLGIEPYMLASSLHLVMAQRLVRRTCDECAQPYEPDPFDLQKLQIQPGAHNFRRGRGCPVCRKSGYAGRVGVFEVMPITNALAKLVEQKASEPVLRLQARDDGMHPLGEAAAERVCAGVTTAEEVLRVVDAIDDGARCPACGRAVEDTFALCPHCAAPLRCTCASCGMKLQKEWQICPYCGAGNKQAAAAMKSTAVPSEVAPPPIPLTPIGATSGGPSTRMYRALVVDDQPDFRRLLSFTLEHSGLPLSVETASGGPEALERVANDRPDVIILDVMMPDMDGFEVCERLRANVRTAFIPILMLTALDDSGSRARGFLAGTDDYISKPFARAELMARVRRLLERSYGTIIPAEPVPPDRGNDCDATSPAPASPA